MAKKHPRELYRSMHQGLEPRRVVAYKPRAYHGPVFDLRRMTAVEGIQVQGGGRGEVLYRHEFEDGAGPMIVRAGNGRNNMALVGGSYRINDEGMIEDDMRHSKHHGHRYMNPESNIAVVVMIGLVVFAATAVTDIIRTALPTRWSNRAKSIGLDIALIAAGLFVFKKSAVWGIGLAATGVASATHMAYEATGLKAKMNNLFHHAAAPAQRTITASVTNADGSFLVTYSDGTTATLPAGTTSNHAVGQTGMLVAGQRRAMMRVPNAAMRAV